jgi:hypothetical protein
MNGCANTTYKHSEQQEPCSGSLYEIRLDCIRKTEGTKHANVIMSCRREAMKRINATRRKPKIVNLRRKKNK